MKILYVSGTYPAKKGDLGGTFIEDRCRGLIKKNYNVELVKIHMYDGILIRLIKKILNKKIYFKQDDIIYDDLVWNCINIKKNIFLKLLNKNLFYLVLERKINKKLMKKFNLKKIDLIHAHIGFPTGYLMSNIAKKLNKKSIITLHGSDIHTHPFRNSEIKEKTLQALNNADKCIFVSNNLLLKAKELGYKKHNYKVINNGINCETEIIYDKYIKNTIGYIGRFEEIKGVLDLPDICDKVRKKIPDLKIVLAGDGRLREDVIKKLKSLEIEVEYLGIIKHAELHNFYKKVNIIVMPSYNEGFPCTAIEAYSFGIPVIASDVGGCKEVIQMLINRDKYFNDTFSKTIIKVLEANMNNKISNEELYKISKKYSWDKIIEKEIKIYKEVLEVI